MSRDVPTSELYFWAESSHCIGAHLIQFITLVSGNQRIMTWIRWD